MLTLFFRLGNNKGTITPKHPLKPCIKTEEEAKRINKITYCGLSPEQQVAGSNPARRTSYLLQNQHPFLFHHPLKCPKRTKNVPKLPQFDVAVPEFEGRSFATRSSFAKASLIMLSLAWLYLLKTPASPCLSIKVTKWSATPPALSLVANV